MPGHGTVQRYEAYKALILLGFCCMLTYYLISHKIKMYINPRFMLLTAAADIVLFLLFVAHVSKIISNQCHIADHCHHHHTTSIWPLVPFIVPLVFVIVMPNATLDASMAAGRGVSISSADTSSTVGSSSTGADTNSSNSGQNQSSPQYSSPVLHDYSQDDRLAVSDDNFVDLIGQIYENPQKFVGKDISVLGFVVRDSDFSPQQIGIVRYVVTCCTADAMPCGLLCEYENAANFKDGTWLEINGTIDMVQMRNTEFAQIKIKSAQAVNEPQMPYVYPRY